MEYVLRETIRQLKAEVQETPPNQDLRHDRRNRQTADNEKYGQFRERTWHQRQRLYFQNRRKAIEGDSVVPWQKTCAWKDCMEPATTGGC